MMYSATSEVTVRFSPWLVTLAAAVVASMVACGSDRGTSSADGASGGSPPMNGGAAGMGGRAADAGYTATRLVGVTDPSDVVIVLDGSPVSALLLSEKDQYGNPGRNIGALIRTADSFFFYQVDSEGRPLATAAGTLRRTY